MLLATLCGTRAPMRSLNKVSFLQSYLMCVYFLAPFLLCTLNLSYEAVCGVVFGNHPMFCAFGKPRSPWGGACSVKGPCASIHSWTTGPCIINITQVQPLDYSANPMACIISCFPDALQESWFMQNSQYKWMPSTTQGIRPSDASPLIAAFALCLIQPLLEVGCL